jgi:choline dehydrogenase-like flavoprotein
MGPLYFERHGAGEYDGDCYTIAPTLLTPKARGWVKLASADPLAKPRILTNSLSDEEDVASLVAGVKLAQRIAASEPLRSKTVKAVLPDDSVASDEDIAEHLRERLELVYHPVGTCRMGTDDDAVVDPELRVHGLTGLRVVDASIMPVIPGGNTNAPTIMVAERAADLVKGRRTAPVAA